MSIINRLDEIKARADSATEGPWSHINDSWQGGRAVHRVGSDGNGDDVGLTYRYEGDAQGEHDAEFIAHSRTDVPDMANTLKRVEALLEQYEADDREHLNTFGQHHPYAGWAADHLREALTGEA